jgi:hypothetical protein
MTPDSHLHRSDEAGCSHCQQLRDDLLVWKGHQNDALAEAERLRRAIRSVIQRPAPDGNDSCAPELERIKGALSDAL